MCVTFVAHGVDTAANGPPFAGWSGRCGPICFVCFLEARRLALADFVRILGGAGSTSCSFSLSPITAQFRAVRGVLRRFQLYFEFSTFSHFSFSPSVRSHLPCQLAPRAIWKYACRQQAKESSRDSRKLPGAAVLFSGVVAPTNEEMRTRASTSGIQHWVSCR